LIYKSQVWSSTWASSADIIPILPKNKDFSKQSNLDNLTVEATLKPLSDQLFNGTFV
jgi:hypothetical protein